MRLIYIERHGNVALIRMRAGKANAMNLRLLEELDLVLEDTEQADAQIITGEHSAFSAGLALPELIELDRDGMSEMIAVFERVMKRVFVSPRATIAAINGHAFAGGCVLALMCDVRLMSAGKIALNEIQLGIGLPSIAIEGIRARLPPEAHGPVVLEGRTFEPAEALRLRLVDEVVAPASLEARALEIATERAAAPIAYAQIKCGLHASLVREWTRSHAHEREQWLDTWFSEHAQLKLRAAVERITKR